MRSDLPPDPVFVREHNGEPLVLNGAALGRVGGGTVSYTGFQLDLSDQLLITLSVNFLDNMRYIDDVRVRRGGAAAPIASLSTSRGALFSYLGYDGLEQLSDSLGRVMMARLRIDAADRILIVGLYDSFSIYKETDLIVIRVNMNAAALYKQCLAGRMLVEI